jgi:hypothetical protein
MLFILTDSVSEVYEQILISELGTSTKRMSLILSFIQYNFTLSNLHSKFEVTLRLTASQSVCLGVEPTQRVATRYYFP